MQAAGEFARDFELSSIADAARAPNLNEGGGCAIWDPESNTAWAAHKDHGVVRPEDDNGRPTGCGAQILPMKFNFAFGQSCRGYDFVNAWCHFFPVGLDAKARHFDC